MRKLIAGIIISLLTILLGATVLVGLVVLLFGGLIILGLLIASPFIVLHYAKNRRLGPVFGWTALVVVVMTIIGVGILWWRTPRRVPKVPVAPGLSQLMVQSLLTTGEFWWKLPDGEYINGRNEIAPNEKLVKVEELDSSHLSLSQEYIEYGRPETMWIRLRSIGNNTWDGPWRQENPECHGRMILEEVAPGIYSGERTWSTGQKARCHIKLNR